MTATGKGYDMSTTHTTTRNMRTRARELESIAKAKLGVDTLEARNSDRLDFHDLGVVSIREALEFAYEAGREAGRREVLGEAIVRTMHARRQAR